MEAGTDRAARRGRGPGQAVLRRAARIQAGGRLPAQRGLPGRAADPERLALLDRAHAQQGGREPHQGAAPGRHGHRCRPGRTGRQRRGRERGLPLRERPTGFRSRPAARRLQLLRHVQRPGRQPVAGAGAQEGPVRELSEAGAGEVVTQAGTEQAADVATDIAAAIGGDEAAFARLTQRYRRELHVHCYRMLASFDEAEDAVQETLLNAWRALDGFDGSMLFRAWLYRIATNVCLDQLRRNARRLAKLQSFAEVPWLQP